MNNELLNSILSSVSINEIIEKMDDSQKNIFLRQLFNNLKTNAENLNLVSFIRYDEESNSIVVSEEEQEIEYTDNGIIEYPIRSSEYKISIDELQNRINSLTGSKQAKTK